MRPKARAIPGLDAGRHAGSSAPKRSHTSLIPQLAVSHGRHPVGKAGPPYATALQRIPVASRRRRAAPRPRRIAKQPRAIQAQSRHPAPANAAELRTDRSALLEDWRRPPELACGNVRNRSTLRAVVGTIGHSELLGSVAPALRSRHRPNGRHHKTYLRHWSRAPMPGPCPALGSRDAVLPDARRYRQRLLRRPMPAFLLVLISSFSETSKRQNHDFSHCPILGGVAHSSSRLSRPCLRSFT